MSKGQPLTKEEFLNFMKEFGRELTQKFEKVDQRFDGIHTKLQKHDVQFGKIDERFNRIDARFERIDQHLERIDVQFVKSDERFISIDQQLSAIRKTLADQDELLETVAAEVSHTQDVLIAIRPHIESHEERITRLEYGMTKLLLKS